MYIYIYIYIPYVSFLVISQSLAMSCLLPGHRSCLSTDHGHGHGHGIFILATHPEGI